MFSKIKMLSVLNCGEIMQSFKQIQSPHYVASWCKAGCYLCVFAQIPNLLCSICSPRPSLCLIFPPSFPLLPSPSLCLSQARVNGLKSCVIVLRILRDMCNRHPVWEPLKGWVSLLLYLHVFECEYKK